VGIVIGAGFSNVINSLVRDLITPIIGAFITNDFSHLSFTINGSIFWYGDFLNAIISFVLIAAVVYFFVIIPMNMLIAKMHKEPPADPANKKCPECLSEIPIAAKRCAFCAQLVS